MRQVLPSRESRLPMLRTLVLLLLLANGLFFAWAQGWLGAAPRQGEREPHRLAAQVAPETVKVLPAAQARAAIQAARADAHLCIETEPLRGSDLKRVEPLLAAASVAPAAVQRMPVTGPGPQDPGTVLRVPEAPPDLAERLAAAGFKPCKPGG
jgi:hypothetical protein